MASKSRAQEHRVHILAGTATYNVTSRIRNVPRSLACLSWDGP